MPASSTFCPTVCSTSYTDLPHLQRVYTGLNIPQQSKNIKKVIMHQSQSDITMATAALSLRIPWFGQWNSLAHHHRKSYHMNNQHRRVSAWGRPLGWAVQFHFSDICRYKQEIGLLFSPLEVGASLASKTKTSEIPRGLPNAPNLICLPDSPRVLLARTFMEYLIYPALGGGDL